MNTIAIDCGASFIKAASIDKAGNIIKKIERKSPPVSLSNSIFEIKQILEIVKNVKEIVSELSLGYSEANLCISNEMHGFILADEKGMPYTDYVSWQRELCMQDDAGHSLYEKLKTDVNIQNYINNSGMPIRAGLPSTNLFYLKQTGRLDMSEGKIYFYTLGSYLIRTFISGEPWEHATNAAATGLYDVNVADWNRGYINFLGLDNIVFPEIKNETVDFYHNGCCLHVFPALGDQQAALLGADFKEETDLSFNIGTGAQVSRIVSVPQVGIGYQIRPYFNGMFLKTVPHIPSGRALNVYTRFCKDILNRFGITKNDNEIWEEINHSLHESTNSQLDVDLSFFENALTERSNGFIDNISEYGLTFDNLWNGIFNTLIENFIQIADRIQPEKKNVKRVIFSGGVARKSDYVRNGIMKCYSEADVCVSKDETLVGLYRYSTQSEFMF